MALQNAFGDLSLEATQQQLKTAVDAVNVSTQNVSALADAVFTLAQDLKTLLVCRGSSADLRVTLLSGTVNTLSNAQSIGGYDARTLVFNAMDSTFCCGNLQYIAVY